MSSKQRQWALVWPNRWWRHVNTFSPNMDNMLDGTRLPRRWRCRAREKKNNARGRKRTTKTSYSMANAYFRWFWVLRLCAYHFICDSHLQANARWLCSAHSAKEHSPNGKRNGSVAFLLQTDMHWIITTEIQWHRTRFLCIVSQFFASSLSSSRFFSQFIFARSLGTNVSRREASSKLHGKRTNWIKRICHRMHLL